MVGIHPVHRTLYQRYTVHERALYFKSKAKKRFSFKFPPPNNKRRPILFDWKLTREHGESGGGGHTNGSYRAHPPGDTNTTIVFQKRVTLGTVELAQVATTLFLTNLQFSKKKTKNKKKGKVKVKKKEKKKKRRCARNDGPSSED